MLFLDFEQPIANLYQKIDKLQKHQYNSENAQNIQHLEEELRHTKTEIYGNLTRWQRVQLARHPERPYTLFYINEICSHFTEIHGDRKAGDDKAMIGGFGKLNEETIMFVGHQKGFNAKTRQYRNFGMPNPEGYRKALRLMKLAEKFSKPIVCFIDTPGAYPGIEAEKRGQGEAIARNLFEMMRLRVPVICIIIGEGASGGALGIGVGDNVAMLQNTWYSVISPESCSSILWRSWENKKKAAEQLQLAAEDMRSFGLIDVIIDEPLGGAHTNPKKTATFVKEHICNQLMNLKQYDGQKLVERRIDKYTKIGEFDEDKK